MAIYNEILAARFAKALVKLFAMKGENPTKQLSGEIMAMHPFFSGVENRFHEGWDRYGIVTNVAAGGAGFNSAVRVRNPVGSGVIIVLEKIFIMGTSASTQPRFSIAAQTVDLTSPASATNTRFDGRGHPTPSAIISSQNNAAFSPALQQWEWNASAVGQQLDVLITDNQELTVTPGDAFTFWNNFANDALNLVFWWRERNLEDAEKAG